MANPISVKGIAKLIDRVGDETVQVAKKLKAQGITGAEIIGLFSQQGQFAFDKEGDVGFVGKVAVTIPAGTTMITLGDGTEAHSDLDFESMGSGTLTVSLTIKVVL